MTQDSYTSKYRDAAVKYLKITEDLATYASEENNTSNFHDVLLPIYRRSRHTLESIMFLFDLKDNITGAFFGHADNALVLMRKLLEDYISIKYIQVKGKDKYAKRLQKFLIKEQFEYLQDLKNLGIDIDNHPGFQEFKLSTEKEYAKISSKMKKNTYWAGTDTSKIIEYLKEENALTDIDANVFTGVYNLSCRTTHTSPWDIVRFTNQPFMTSELPMFVKIGLTIALVCCIDLTLIYIEEIHTSSATKKFNDLKRDVLDLRKEVHSIK